MADKQRFDVAISFLVRDEKIAAALKNQLAGLNVFFFPHKQEELVGTNGLESMREPFSTARVDVVLYRKPWGETPWTGVEQVAITDRCLKEKFRPLVFVQLDPKDSLPDWLPETHVRFALDQYGIEQLAGAVKARVEELGGEIKPLDAMAEAKRVREEADYLAEREELMGDRAWIDGTVHAAIRATVAELVRLVDHAKKEHGFDIVCIARDRACVLRSGFVSMAVDWHQPYYNTVADDRDRGEECYLRVSEYSGLVLGPGENGFLMHRPRELKKHKFKVDVSLTRQLIWREVGVANSVSPEHLADRIMRIFFDLVSRANNGQVERPFL